MRAGIPTRASRARLLTLYVDKQQLNRQLGIETEQEITLLLVRKDGVIIWRETGVWSPAKADSLDENLLALTPLARLPEALDRVEFSADDIAAELGLSKRTRQRRLSTEIITFKELLDLYRQEQAMLLQNGERNMGSIVYALGYNEQSSFNRAIRRWTGQSPSAWLR